MYLYENAHTYSYTHTKHIKNSLPDVLTEINTNNTLPDKNPVIKNNLLHKSWYQRLTNLFSIFCL